MESRIASRAVRSGRPGFWLSVGLGLLLATGCVEDSGDAADDEPADSGAGGGGGASGAAGSGGGATGGTGGGDPTGGAGGGLVGGAGGGGQGGSGGTGGEAPLIANCQGMCDAYAACDLLQPTFGDEDACLLLCERTLEGPGGDTWRLCVSRSGCGILDRCRVPEPTSPTCAETCDALFDCGEDFPDGDCLETCAASPQAFRECGFEVTEGQCRGDAFYGCLADAEVFPGCAEICAATDACGGANPDCPRDCARRLRDDDPLAAERWSEVPECLGRAGDDCGAVDACINGIGALPVDQATFCRLFNACADEIGFPCEEAWFFLTQEGGQDAARCAIEDLADGCPPDPIESAFACIEGGGGGPGGNCQDYCHAQTVCGLSDEPEAECVRACFDATGTGSPEGRRLAAELPCGDAVSCEAFQVCVQTNSAEAECGRLCGARLQCGLDEDVDCPARCLESYGLQRGDSWRACLVAAERDCPAVAACTLAEPPPCDAYCARQVECGDIIEARAGACAATCDDQAFRDPTGTRDRIACALSAPACGDGDFRRGAHTVEACVAFDVSGGAACARWCEATVTCEGGDDEAWLACLQACGAGFEGADAIRFEAAYACLGSSPAGDCAGAATCLPDAEPVDCEARCAGLDACGLAGETCAADCGEDPLGRVRARQQGRCLGDAGDGCEAVGACLGAQEIEPPEPPTQQAFCAAWDGCGLGIEFPCEEAWQIFGQEGGGRPEAIACAFNLLNARCPNIDELFVTCFEGGGEVGGFDPDCVALCQGQALCGALADGVDRAGCAAACTDALRFGGDEASRQAATLVCGGSGSCDDLGSCLEAFSPAGQCATQCDALGVCGLADDQAACAVECEATFARGRATAERACVSEAEGDCEAIAACDDLPSLPCEAFCEVQESCGFDAGEGCLARCDDDAFLAPAETAIRVACVLEAPGCFGFGDDMEAEPSVERCNFDPGIRESPCTAFCRATRLCGDGGDFGACIEGCFGGLPAEDELVFAAASECLSALPSGAACEAVVECLPAGPPEVDCAATCDALAGCAIPAEDCAAACADAPDRTAAGCVAARARAESDCGSLAACVGYEPEPASESCQRLCAREAVCGVADAFLCERACIPEPEAAGIWAACAEARDCGRVEACRELPFELDARCDAPCQAAAACGGFEDPAACAALCTGRLTSPFADDAFADGLADCVEQAGAGGEGEICEAAPDCFELAAGCAERPDAVLVPPEGGRFQVDTGGLPNTYDATCGGQGPDAVFVLRLGAPADLVFETVDNEYDTLIFVRRDDCDAREAEIACNDDFEGLESRIDLPAAPAGTYYLFVDGFGGGAGETGVNITVRPR